jgi:Tetratricopeptide repeat
VAIEVFHKTLPKVIGLANVNPQRGIETIDTGPVRCIFRQRNRLSKDMGYLRMAWRRLQSSHHKLRRQRHCRGGFARPMATRPRGGTRPLRLPRTSLLTQRAELRLKLGQAAGAESDLREAIALAQKMGTKPWKLRASTSLARLLRDTGRRDGAQSMLAEIYGSFTEGFDTADLKDAKALLDELSA